MLKERLLVNISYGFIGWINNQYYQLIDNHMEIWQIKYDGTLDDYGKKILEWKLNSFSKHQFEISVNKLDCDEERKQLILKGGRIHLFTIVKTQQIP